jgi:hypothetical protein
MQAISSNALVSQPVSHSPLVGCEDVGCKIEVNNYIVMHFLKLSLWAIFFLLHRRLEGKL